jgi:hypothetical protein
METTQGLSLVAIFILNLQICHVTYYLFFSAKLENRSAEQVLPRVGWEIGTGGSGELVGKGVGGLKWCK